VDLPRFKNIAPQLGLETFHLTSGTPEKRYIIEANSAGVCLFDYD